MSTTFFKEFLNKTILTIESSYEKNSTRLSNQEISDLCAHESLLKKVHKELKSRTCPDNLYSYDLSLQVYEQSGSNFNDLKQFVLRNCSNEGENYLESIFCHRFSSFLGYTEFENPKSKLIYKVGKDSAWAAANRCLYQNGDLTVEAKKNLKKGFSLQDIDSYEGIDLAVILCACNVSDIWTSHDFTYILDVCAKNERYVFLALYPYLLKFLGNASWTTLLPVFHFVPKSFSSFIQKVSNYLNKGTVLLHNYRVLYVKQPFKNVLRILSIDYIRSYIVRVFPIMHDIMLNTLLTTFFFVLYVESIKLRVYLLSFLF